MIFDHEKWMGTTAAANALGTSPHTVRTMVRRGDLKAIRVGAQFRIERASVQRVLDAPVYEVVPTE